MEGESCVAFSITQSTEPGGTNKTSEGPMSPSRFPCASSFSLFALISLSHQMLHPNTMQTCAFLDPSRPLARQGFCRQVFSPFIFSETWMQTPFFKFVFSFYSSCSFCEKGRFLIMLHQASLQPTHGHRGPLGHPKAMPLTEPHGILLWLRPLHATLSMLWFDFSVNNLARLVLGFVMRRMFSSYAT